MKKLLGISVVAMLAVSPMMASATPVPATLVEPTTATDQAPAANTDHAPKYAPANIQAADASHIASTAYVKGAYNAAIAAVNKVYDTATGAAETALSNAGGNGIAWNANSEALDVDLAGKSGLTMGTGDDAGKLMVDAGNGLAINATSGALEAKLDGETLANSATGLKVKAGGITSTELANSAVTSGKIDTGAVAFGNVATADVVKSTDNSGAGIGTAGAQGTASDSKFVTEKAVAEALASATANTAATAGNGLNKNGNEFSVKAGNGIAVDSNGVKVNYTADKGLAFHATDGTLEIKDGAGIKTSSNGVEVDLKSTGSALEFDANGGLGVDVGSTITVGANGLEVADTSLTVGKIDTNDLVNSANATYSGNTDLVQQGYVDEKVAGLQAGVVATIDAATIKLYTTWGNDTDAATGNAAAGTIDSSGYTQGS